MIVTMTFGVVLFTILVQGTTIEPVARILGLLRETAGGQAAAGSSRQPPADAS